MLDRRQEAIVIEHLHEIRDADERAALGEGEIDRVGAAATRRTPAATAHSGSKTRSRCALAAVRTLTPPPGRNAGLPVGEGL